MLPLVAGAAILLLTMMLVRGYAGANAKHVAAALRVVGSLALGALAAFLAVRGRFDFALLAGGAAWAMFLGQKMPWNRGGPAGGNTAGQGAPPPQRSGRMSRREALQVLDLKEGASEEEIRAAHRRLIMQTHPDRGGSSYLAAKINEAKDVLVGK